MRYTRTLAPFCLNRIRIPPLSGLYGTLRQRIGRNEKANDSLLLEREELPGSGFWSLLQSVLIREGIYVFKVDIPLRF
jgi:hypothetical protein